MLKNRNSILRIAKLIPMFIPFLDNMYTYIGVGVCVCMCGCHTHYIIVYNCIIEYHSLKVKPPDLGCAKLLPPLFTGWIIHGEIRGVHFGLCMHAAEAEASED